jgi:hypothetical protein
VVYQNGAVNGELRVSVWCLDDLCELCAHVARSVFSVTKRKYFMSGFACCCAGDGRRRGVVFVQAQFHPVGSLSRLVEQLFFSGGVRFSLCRGANLLGRFCQKPPYEFVIFFHGFHIFIHHFARRVYFISDVLSVKAFPNAFPGALLNGCRGGACLFLQNEMLGAHGLKRSARLLIFQKFVQEGRDVSMYAHVPVFYRLGGFFKMGNSLRGTSSGIGRPCSLFEVPVYVRK